MVISVASLYDTVNKALMFVFSFEEAFFDSGTQIAPLMIIGVYSAPEV
jgi:hypothetical protein